MATGLFDRRLSWSRRLLHANLDSGKPALADDPRSTRSSSRHRRRHRAIGKTLAASTPVRIRHGADQATQSYAAFGGGAHAVRDLSPASAGWARLDGRAGVLLQRDLLHLCAGVDRFL